MPTEKLRREDNLYESFDKVKKAIESVGQAEFDSKRALSLTESLRIELDTIVVAGDSGPEAAQARVDEEGEVHVTLKKRIDSGFNKVKSRMDDEIEEVTLLVNDALVEVEQLREDENGVVHETAKTRVDQIALKMPKVDTVSIRDFNVIGDGVASDSAAFQSALNIARDKGQVVISIPKGIYRMTEELKLYSNTKIICQHGVVIVRDHTGYMAMNGNRSSEADPSNYSRYNGRGNIHIEGGIWDANGGVQTNKASIFHLGHGDNIIFDGMTLKDCSNSHHVEFNACRNIVVQDCKFLGWFGGEDTFNEAIQLDISRHTSTTIKADDDTPCQNVWITRCYFGKSDTPNSKPIGRAIGSHTAVITRPHEHVHIHNNIFDDTESWTVRPFNWKNSTITDNIFNRCRYAINWRAAITGPNTEGPTGAQLGAEVNEYGIISGNIIRDASGFGRAIEIYGETGTNGRVKGINVVNNVITMLNADRSYDAIVFSYAEDCTCIGNRILGAGGNGIRTQANSNNITIQGNAIRSSEGNGILVNSSNYVNVNGNTVLLSRQNGIFADNSSNGISIVGNIIAGANGGGTLNQYSNIRVAGNTDIVTIVGNTLRDFGSTFSTADGIYASNTTTKVSISGNNAVGFRIDNRATGGTLDAQGNLT